MSKAQVKDETAEASVIIELPTAEVPLTTWGLHVDTKLTPKQSQALRSIAAGLDRAQARLENGGRVVSPNDAMKFMLEQAGTVR